MIATKQEKKIEEQLEHENEKRIQEESFILYVTRSHKQLLRLQELLTKYFK